VILLDTHAAIWLARGDRRTRVLNGLPRLYLSPATVLELQFLAEVGRVRFTSSVSAATFASDTRWRMDEPPAGRWFETACDVGWTRDPFDRLLAAHARLRRWKLATADEVLLSQLGASEALPL